MPMLFRICRRGSPAKWIVLLGRQPYGEYLDQSEAILDAIEAARDARALGHEAEVRDRDDLRVY